MHHNRAAPAHLFTVLARDEQAQRGRLAIGGAIQVDGGLLRHPHFGALLTWHAQVFHMAVIAFVVGADSIGGSAFLMWMPAAAVTAVYWASISPRSRRREAAPASVERDGQVHEPAHEARAQPLGVTR